MCPQQVRTGGEVFKHLGHITEELQVIKMVVWYVQDQQAGRNHCTDRAGLGQPVD